MPKRILRKKGIGSSPQVRGTSSSGGGAGPDKYDGRENMSAGSPKDQPKEVSGKGVVIKTYGA